MNSDTLQLIVVAAIIGGAVLSIVLRLRRAIRNKDFKGCGSCVLKDSCNRAEKPVRSERCDKSSEETLNKSAIKNNVGKNMPE